MEVVHLPRVLRSPSEHPWSTSGKLSCREPLESLRRREWKESRKVVRYVFLISNKNVAITDYICYTAQHGPIIQYRGFAGESILSVSDPKTIQHMLMVKTNNFPKPREEVRGLERMTGRGLLTVEGATHRRQARLLAPSFSQAQTETYLPTIIEVADKVSLPFVLPLRVHLLSDSLLHLIARQTHIRRCGQNKLKERKHGSSRPYYRRLQLAI